MAKAQRTQALRAVAASLLTAGCLAFAGTPALAGEEVTVSIQDYRYHPTELTVVAGTTVRWTNDERRTSHDVYFPDEDLGSPRLFPEESWSRRFDRPGEYRYYCRPHENHDSMHAIVSVVPAK